MTSSLGHRAARGAVWATLDRFGSMGIQFVSNMVMARLLIPEDYGAIGMLSIFLMVSTVVIDGGFGGALIQKKEPTQTDYSTILYWNISVALVLYCILFAGSPLIADFFHLPVLKDLMRVLGLNLVLNAITAIQGVRLRKQLQFKTIAVINLSASFATSVLGIVMAWNGCGVWSLVGAQLSYVALTIVLYGVVTRWLPSRVFSAGTMRDLFSFGGYIFAATILQEVCRNLQGVIIGKKFSATELGYYSQAYKLDNVTSYSIPQVIVNVMYPVYSQIQDDHARLSQMTLMNVRVISFIIVPLMATLIVVAGPLIDLLYGQKWMPCVPYFQILCVGGIFVSLQNINFYGVAAVGKSRPLFLWSFYKWGFLALALLVGMELGMYGILWGMVVSSFNIYIVNAALLQCHVGLSVMSQLVSLLPTALTAAVPACGVYALGRCGVIDPIWGILIIPSVYLALARVLKARALSETMEVVKKLLKNDIS